MMVYDITDSETFENLNSWLMEIEKNASKDVYKILVGNKCDMESDRKVTVEQGKEFAQKYKMQFFETSAKNSINVQQAFEAMTREIINDNKETNIHTKKDNIVVSENISNSKNIKTKGNCC